MLVQKYKRLSKDFETNEYLEDVLTEYETYFQHTLEENEKLIKAFNTIFSHLKKIEPLLKEQKSHKNKELKSVSKRLDSLRKEVKEIRKEVKWNRKN